LEIASDEEYKVLSHQIYIEWSRHEPQPGVFDFEGENDIERFVQLAQQNDLFVILRPGPFIDAGESQP
jgi:beta-galactosidase GanA